MSKSAEAFRTISEVADLLETPTHVLRFWESKFPQIKPVKRAGGRRYYRPADVALLSGIKRLLHDDGMTIRGVQKLIKEQGAKQISEGFEPEEEGAAADGAAAAPPESAPETAVEETPWQAAPTLETTGFAAPAEALEPAPEAAAEPAPPLAEEAPLGERLAQHPAEDLPEAGAPQEALWEEPAAAFETSGIAAPAEALEVSEAQPAAPEPAWEPPAAFESTSFPAPTEALDPATEPAPDPAPPLAEEPPLAERLAQHPVEALPEAHPPQEEPWEEPGAAFETSGIAAPAEALA
ncbi:MAG: MerR family transcriptional regulator, partial [Paenirhodobacter sp.]|uniref:MerR family transcriptional regulator n=1 Tax=Paenirhodobacter sp. TaxID=1965326 RepID=UPI003D12088F